MSSIKKTNPYKCVLKEDSTSIVKRNLMENNTTIETAIEKINARFDALGKFLVQPKQYPPLSIMSDAIDQLATATALAKNEWPRITKDSIAHRHRYAKYEDILIATTPILSKQGLTVFQFVERSEYGDLGIRTLITHAFFHY
jgi:hypothetical protein